eukprot:m.56412 g.56412  ORF g.56412 m.56412 type:complete len:74 (+) comp7673_c0_seq1:602-823(+)
MTDVLVALVFMMTHTSTEPNITTATTFNNILVPCHTGGLLCSLTASLPIITLPLGSRHTHPTSDGSGQGTTVT